MKMRLIVADEPAIKRNVIVIRHGFDEEQPVAEEQPVN
jgi:hypothetical protein